MKDIVGQVGRVVHCKVEPYDVYIGRGRGSVWGNPFIVGVHGTRQQVLDKYDEWIMTQPDLIEQARAELRGKVLGCWCKPQRCHGDRLAQIANAE